MDKTIALVLYFACFGFLGWFSLTLNKNIGSSWGKKVSWYLIWVSMIFMFVCLFLLWSVVGDVK